MIAVFVMLFLKTQQPQQPEQPDGIPDNVVATILAGEPVHGFGANAAALLSVLGGRGSRRRGYEEQREYHALRHGVLLALSMRAWPMNGPRRGFLQQTFGVDKANARIGVRSG